MSMKKRARQRVLALQRHVASCLPSAAPGVKSSGATGGITDGEHCREAGESALRRCNPQSASVVLSARSSSSSEQGSHQSSPASAGATIAISSLSRLAGDALLSTLAATAPRPGGLLDAMRLRGMLPAFGAAALKSRLSPVLQVAAQYSPVLSVPHGVREGGQHRAASDRSQRITAPVERLAPPRSGARVAVAALAGCNPAALPMPSATSGGPSETVTSGSNRAALEAPAADMLDRPGATGQPVPGNPQPRNLQLGDTLPRDALSRLAASSLLASPGASPSSQGKSGKRSLARLSSARKVKVSRTAGASAGLAATECTHAVPSPPPASPRVCTPMWPPVPGFPSAPRTAPQARSVPSEAWLELRQVALPPADPADNYELSEKGEDSEAEEPDRGGKHVPAWSLNFLSLIEKQADTDPDTIFGCRVPACDLEAIFRDADYTRCQRDRPRRRRGSSGEWRRDRLSQKEVAEYKRKMGHKNRWVRNEDNIPSK